MDGSVAYEVIDMRTRFCRPVTTEHFGPITELQHPQVRAERGKQCVFSLPRAEEIAEGLAHLNLPAEHFYFCPETDYPFCYLHVLVLVGFHSFAPADLEAQRVRQQIDERTERYDRFRAQQRYDRLLRAIQKETPELFAHALSVFYPQVSEGITAPSDSPFSLTCYAKQPYGHTSVSPALVADTQPLDDRLSFLTNIFRKGERYH